MAVTTPISELRLPRPFYTRYNNTCVLYGHECPDNVTDIMVITFADPPRRECRWISRVGGERTEHRMPFDESLETINAILVAMRLTC